CVYVCLYVCVCVRASLSLHGTRAEMHSHRGLAHDGCSRKMCVCVCVCVCVYMCQYEELEEWYILLISSYSNSKNISFYVCTNVCVCECVCVCVCVCDCLCSVSMHMCLCARVYE